MKQVHRKCPGNYQHYFVRTHNSRAEIDPGAWDRTIQLECSRCGYVMWLDSVIRTLPHSDLKKILGL